MLAVLGDVADAVLASESSARVSDVVAGEHDRARSDACRSPRSASTSSRLAVAFDAGDADDLAAMHGQRHVVEHAPVRPR